MMKNHAVCALFFQIYGWKKKVWKESKMYAKMMTTFRDFGVEQGVGNLNVDMLCKIL